MASKKLSAAKPSAADLVDDQLARYRSMRDFTITAEPSGTSARRHGGPTSANKAAGTFKLPFVIQKHAASHLHYDFRLGWQGVLKSWACAKGPSLNTRNKRLAVQVEDHPMEYAGFEGIIPAGQYGGGTVMVWDEGTWEPQAGQDVDRGLRDGSLKFVLYGTKLHGKWALIRMHPREHESKPSWLLIKEHDEYEADTEADADSVVTGRTLEQIAEDSDHVWQSKDTAKPGQAWQRTNNGRSSRDAKIDDDLDRRKLNGCPKEQQPEFVKPALAMEAAAPPDAAGWLHELKLDGYRIQARKTGTKVKLLTRSGLDWTHRMKPVADGVKSLKVANCTVDGEVVVLGTDGNSSFAALQAWFQNGDEHPLTYFAFDLLHLAGHNTRGLPLRERKKMLADVLPADSDTLRLSEHMETSGERMFQHACELHAEGIVSKRADSTYRSSRNADWLKSKCLHEQEFVLVGYTLSNEGDDRIGSLLLGYYETDAGAKAASLIYAGRTGTGFTQRMKREMLLQLKRLEQKTSSLAKVPADARRGVHWIAPRLVAQVRFATWTAERLVRQAAFLGLREDKEPTEVRREEPSVPPRPKQKSSTDKKHADDGEVKGKAAAGTRRLTHPDKVLDVASGLTKRELADFYEAIAPHMLTHIAGRPLSLVRCPDGAGHPCFFQKHVNAMLGDSIETIEVPDKKTGKLEPYITLSTAEALVSLAQLGVLEVHPWGSRNDDLERPDRLIFDLDPDEAIDWRTLCDAAAEVRLRLKRCGLESFLKVTGGKGLHVVAPIEPEADWAVIKDAAHRFAVSLERAQPKLFLSKMSKAARKGKIYCDYLRNERGATAVAAYSPRARAGMHVALPLPWTALKEKERPSFPVREMKEWKSRLKSDPWKRMMSMKQSFLADKFDTL